MRTIPAPARAPDIRHDTTERFEFDFTDWLDGDAISGTPVVEISNEVGQSNPSVDLVAIIASVVSIWVAAPGWVVGISYRLSVTVCSANGRSETFSMRMRCVRQ